MSNCYAFATSLLWEHDEDDIFNVEFDVEVVYGVEWGYAATYMEPGAGDAVVDVEITKVDGKTWADFVAALPFGLTARIAEGALTSKILDEDYNRMIDAAADSDECARADWDDLRRDERDEDDRYWANRDLGD